MRAILLSVQPKWCELIASGIKTVEVRKTKPKIETPFKCYIYCTYSDLLTKSHNTGQIYVAISKKYQGTLEKRGNTTLSGKVIGEFVCDYIMRHCNMQNADLAEQQGMIKRELLFDYANGKELFGWHISNLVIYDEPKELDWFHKPVDCKKESCQGCWDCEIKKPPQSWCYVEEVTK